MVQRPACDGGLPLSCWACASCQCTVRSTTLLAQLPKRCCLPAGAAAQGACSVAPTLWCLQWQVRFEVFSPLVVYNFTAYARNVMGWGGPSNVVDFLAPNVSNAAAAWQGGMCTARPGIARVASFFFLRRVCLQGRYLKCSRLARQRPC